MEIFKGQVCKFSISGGKKGFEKTRLMQNLSVLKSTYYLPLPLWDFREEIRVMRRPTRILPRGIYIIIKLIFAGVISAVEKRTQRISKQDREY